MGVAKSRTWLKWLNTHVDRLSNRIANDKASLWNKRLDRRTWMKGWKVLFQFWSYPVGSWRKNPTNPHIHHSGIPERGTDVRAFIAVIFQLWGKSRRVWSEHPWSGSRKKWGKQLRSGYWFFQTFGQTNGAWERQRPRLVTSNLMTCLIHLSVLMIISICALIKKKILGIVVIGNEKLLKICLLLCLILNCGKTHNVKFPILTIFTLTAQ